MPTLLERWEIARGSESVDLRKRVEMAVVLLAASILGEDPATADHEYRAGVARQVTGSPHSWVDQAMLAIAVSDDAVSAGKLTDEMIFAIVADAAQVPLTPPVVPKTEPV